MIFIIQTNVRKIVHLLLYAFFLAFFLGVVLSTTLPIEGEMQILLADSIGIPSTKWINSDVTYRRKAALK